MAVGVAAAVALVRLGQGESDRVGSEHGGACCIPQALAPAVHRSGEACRLRPGEEGGRCCPAPMVGPAAGEVNP